MIVSALSAAGTDSLPIVHNPAVRICTRHPVQWQLKLAIDRLLALTMLLLLFPSILLILSIVVITDFGAPIFSHRRVGRGGSSFACLKVRSMRRNSAVILAELLERDEGAAREWRETRKLRNDPRIIPFGRFIRATSLDELPQLINILRGEMSFVGPRPIVVDELARYGDAASHYLAAVPGLTGLWQVSGRSNLSYEDRVALDVEYVENWSLWQDFRILIKTPRAVIAMAGAC